MRPLFLFFFENCAPSFAKNRLLPWKQQLSLKNLVSAASIVQL